MRQTTRVVGRIIGFVVLAALLTLRIAVAAVLTIAAPILMPFLALLSGGGLLIAIGFTCIGHWHDALKGVTASAICSLALVVIAGVAELAIPNFFSTSVALRNRSTLN